MALERTLASLAEALLREESRSRAAVKVLEAALEVTGSRVGCLGALDPQTGRVRWLASEPESWSGGEGEGFSAPDAVARDVRVLEGMPRVGGPDGRGARRLLIAPAVLNGAPVGRLILGDARRPYGDAAVASAGRLARLWAAALGRTCMEARLRELPAPEAALLDSHPDGVVVVVDRAFAYVNPAFADLLGRTQEELWGRCPTDFVDPAEQAQVAVRIATYQGGTREQPSEYRLMREDGTVIPVEAISRFIAWGDRPAFLSVFRDISRRKRAEDDLHRRQILLQTLADFDQTVSHGSRTLVVRSALDFIRGKVGADRLSVALREAGSEVARLMYADGAGVVRLSSGVRFPLAGTGIGEAMLTGRAVYETDFAAAPRSSLHADLLRLGLRSGFTVPLIAAGECLGTLNATSRAVEGIPEGDRELLARLAPRLAAALHNSILYEDLQASAERFRRIFDTVPVSIWLEDFSALQGTLDLLRGQGVSDWRRYVDGHPEFVRAAARQIRVLDVNDYTLKLYGAQSKAELLGSLDRVFTEESYTVFADLLVALAEGSTFLECEAVNRSIAGEVLTVMLKAEFPKVGDDFSRVTVSVTDLTTRRRAEDELRYRTRLESLIATISTRFVHLGPDEVEQGIRQALQAIGTFADAERCYAFVLSEDRARVDEILEWCAPGAVGGLERWAGDAARELEWFAGRILSGKAVLVTDRLALPPEAVRERQVLEERGLQSLVLAPMSSRGGVVGAVGLDSTRVGRPWSDDVLGLLKIAGEIFVGAVERQRSEQALRQARDGLEQRVRARTADLEEATRALQEDIAARRRAEEEKESLERELRQSRVLEAVGQLAGGVAHDFNNILGSVIGCLYAAKLRAGADPTLRDELERAQALCKRGGELTRQLLTVARRRPGRPQTQDLSGLFEEARVLLERTLPKSIALEIDLEPGLPAVRADRSMFTAALLNLGLNARDAMPHGGRLQVSARRTASGDAGGEWVDVEVTDTGVGIPAALQDRVFDPFFTTKAPGEGTGLGLSMVEATVCECGGRVSLRSRPGAGTTFCLRFPAEPPAVRGCAPTGTTCHPCTASPVLVVEDEEAVARMVVQVLEAFGYATLRAANGVEALERLRDHRGDLGLVILDLILPELSGEEVYRLLKGLAPEVAVLLVTGREDRARALAPGAPLLAKPFTPDELIDAVAELLGGARLGG